MDFHEVVSTTRAMRRLDPQRPVDDEVIDQLLEAATLGPSGGNAQPVRWLVVRDADKRAELGSIYKRASAGIFDPYRKVADSNPIARSVLHLVDHMGDAPAIVIPCTRGRSQQDPDSYFGEPWDNPLLMAAGSVWPCVQNLCLRARSLGLGATPTVIHNVHEAEVHDILGIPEDRLAWCMIPVGYPLGRWGTPRRKPVSEVSFRDVWGLPWNVPDPGTSGAVK